MITIKEDVERFLTEEAQKQAGVASLAETIRTNFYAEALEKVAIYQRERAQLEPEAKAKLETVFKPWLADFLGNGTYDRTFQYINDNHLGSVTLARGVLYPWSKSGSHESVGENAYAGVAKSIAEAELKGSHYEAVRLSNVYLGYIRNEELWQGFLNIQGSPYYRTQFYGLAISRVPERGANMFFGMGSYWDLRIPLKTSESANDLIAKTHPDLVIGLSEQIESGEIWTTMEENLRATMERKHNRGNVPSSDEIRKQRSYYEGLKQKRRQEYLDRKGRTDWIPTPQY